MINAVFSTIFDYLKKYNVLNRLTALVMRRSLFKRLHIHNYHTLFIQIYHNHYTCITLRSNESLWYWLGYNTLATITDTRNDWPRQAYSALLGQSYRLLSWLGWSFTRCWLDGWWTKLVATVSPHPATGMSTRWVCRVSLLTLVDILVVRAIKSTSGSDLLESRWDLDGHGATLTARPVLERHTCVAQIWILKCYHFVACKQFAINYAKSVRNYQISADAITGEQG